MLEGVLKGGHKVCKIYVNSVKYFLVPNSLPEKVILRSMSDGVILFCTPPLRKAPMLKIVSVLSCASLAISLKANLHASSMA